MEQTGHSPNDHGVTDEWARRAYVDDAKYRAMYEASVS